MVRTAPAWGTLEIEPDARGRVVSDETAFARLGGTEVRSTRGTIPATPIRSPTSWGSPFAFPDNVAATAYSCAKSHFERRQLWRNSASVASAAVPEASLPSKKPTNRSGAFCALTVVSK